jgi:hypothetical protein
MDDIPFYKRPWFYITSRLVFWLIIFGWQIYELGGFYANEATILRDIFIAFLFFFVWMAFFSQFVLPINKFRDRIKIFNRLLKHLSRSHGPALFVENGVIRKHAEETLQRGPGVVWLDSASAGVTRTAAAVKKVVGPGVHFTNADEFIDDNTGTLDLHIQSQKLGPKDEDKPFDEKKEEQSQEQYDDIQKRRRQVSALSRDGIELVPDISVLFRVNTGFPAKDEAGSRFGYRTGTTPEAKLQESLDQEVIRKALLGEGVNPNMDIESSLHRVAWNRLPAMVAVDVWREYAAKFTLDEIFNQTQAPPQGPLKGTGPTSADFGPMETPSQVSAASGGLEGTMRLLTNLNNTIERTIKTLEKRDGSGSSVMVASPPHGSARSAVNVPPANKTALQVINEMVKARLTQPKVDFMDEYGKQKTGQFDSREYELLQQRGLKILSVNISNVRLHPTVQETLIKQWGANWLRLAKGESELLDFNRNLIETAAQEKAQCMYAIRVSRDIDGACKKGKPSVEGLLKAILLRSRAMIRSGEFSNSLRRRMVTEVQDIEDTIRWLGEDGT